MLDSAIDDASIIRVYVGHVRLGLQSRLFYGLNLGFAYCKRRQFRGLWSIYCMVTLLLGEGSLKMYSFR